MEVSQHASMRRAKARRRQGHIATGPGSSKGGRPTSARPGSARAGQRAMNSGMEELYRQRKERERERERAYRDARHRGGPISLNPPTSAVSERPFCRMEPVIPPSPLLTQYSPTTPVAPAWPDRLSSAHNCLTPLSAPTAALPPTMPLAAASPKPDVAPLAAPITTKKTNAFTKLFSRRKKPLPAVQHDPTVTSTTSSASTNSSQITTASKPMPDIPATDHRAILTSRSAAKSMDILRTVNENGSLHSHAADTDTRPGTHRSDQEYPTHIGGRPRGNIRRMASRQSISAFFGISPPKDAEAQRLFSPKGMPTSAFTRPASDASSYQVVLHKRPQSPSMSEVFKAAPSINGDLSAEQSPFNSYKLNSSYQGIPAPPLSFTSIRGNSMPDYFSSAYDTSDLSASSQAFVPSPPRRAVYKTVDAAHTPVKTKFSPTKQPASARGVVHNVARRTPAGRGAPAIVLPASKIPTRNGRATPVSPGFKPLPLILPAAQRAGSLKHRSASPILNRRDEPQEPVTGKKLSSLSKRFESVTAAVLQDEASEGNQTQTSTISQPSRPASIDRPASGMFGKLHYRERSPSNFSNASRKIRPPPLDLAQPTRNANFLEWLVPPTAETIKPTTPSIIPRDDSGFNDNGTDILRPGPKYYHDTEITPRRASVMDSDPLFNPELSFGSQADTEERHMRAVSRYAVWAQTDGLPSPDEVSTTPDLPEPGNTLASSTDVIPRLHPRVAAYDGHRFEDSTRAIKSPPRSPVYMPDAKHDYARFVSNTVTVHAFKERIVSDASTQTMQEDQDSLSSPSSLCEHRVSELFDWVLKRSAALQSSRFANATVASAINPPRSATQLPVSVASSASVDSLAGLSQVLQEQMRITQAISQQLQKHENDSTNALNIAMQQIASLESENAALLGRLGGRNRR